jgi:hypothetical protein
MATSSPDQMIGTIVELYGKISSSLQQTPSPSNGAAFRVNYARVFQAWLNSQITTVQFDIQARRFVDGGCLSLHSTLVVALLRTDDMYEAQVPLLKRIILAMLKVNRSGRLEDPHAAEISSMESNALELSILAVEWAVKNLLESILYQKWLNFRQIDVDSACGDSHNGITNLSLTDLIDHTSHNVLMNGALSRLQFRKS